jgi:hypothetical protein
MKDDSIKNKTIGEVNKKIANLQEKYSLKLNWQKNNKSKN